MATPEQPGGLLSGQIEKFLDQLVYGRGLSGNTKTAYRADLEAFGHFLGARGIRDMRLATRADIAKFLEFEHGAKFADTTVARRFVALKVFYDWLADEGEIKASPAQSLASPRLPRLLPDTLTEAQVRALVTAFDGDDPIPLRNRAMLELLYACGLRASELTGLALDDVHLAEAFLRCTGKGDKQRVVPIGEKAVEALRAYLEKGRPAFALKGDDQSLFISSRGKGITRETLWRVVDEAARKSGLAGKVHPHTLRHCFATHLLSHGANIRAIQEMLGHANVATTQIYTHVDAQKLIETHRRFHPRP